MKRCKAFLLTHSTAASRDGRLFTIEYLKSLRLKTSRRIQAKATRYACISAASLSLNPYSPKPKDLASLIEVFYAMPLQPMPQNPLNTTINQISA